MQTNKEIRKELLKKRWAISDKEKAKFDEIIFKKLKDIILSLNKDRYIALYWPIENEVDTIELCNTLLNNQYKICIPKISGEFMDFISIDSINFEGEFWHSMKQPKTNNKINPNDIQLMIVPLVGFTKSNYRMGYGMNFYNNYLKDNNIKTIGIAYSFQQNDNINITEKDIKLNKIITEK